MLDETTPEVTAIEVSTRGARETNKASPTSSCPCKLTRRGRLQLYPVKRPQKKKVEPLQSN
jgi:hypothetical protein